MRDERGAEGWSVAESWTQLRIATDETAPQSPKRVASFPLRAGWTGGTDVTRGAATFFLKSEPFITVYASLWLKVSPGWRGPPSGTNAFAHFSVDDTDRVAIGVVGSGRGTLTPALFLTDAAPDARVTLPPNVDASSELVRGSWQRWEVLLVINTSGSADGIARWWVDGVLAGDYRDLKFVAEDEAAGWSAFQARLAWGTQADLIPRNMRLRVDHASISASTEREPGTTDPPPPPARVAASVTISPSSAALAPAESIQLVAAVRDSAGMEIAGHPVDWRTTNVGVATASSFGVVTGVAPGEAGVVASAGALADTAAVTVRAPLPPPPQPGTCVAPTIASHGFDDGQASPFQLTEGLVLAPDATANGGWSVRKDWTGGSHDGGTVWLSFPTMPTRVVYARWRFKYDARFDVNGIFKMIRFQDPDFGRLNGTLLIQWGHFVWAWDDYEPAFYENVGPEITPASLAGQWHWYEVMNDISTDGRPRVRLWIDGHLKLDATGTSTAPTNGRTFGTIQWTGTYNSPAATATSWIDDIAVSVTCIGVPGGPPPLPVTVTGLVVSPSTASLAAGATQQFTASERLSDASIRPATGVIWSATGGLILPTGLFTAGLASGSYRVIGVGLSGHADTSTVTVSTTSEPPPSGGAATNECASPRAEWIWCDDFEQDRLSGYFEVDNAGGSFARTGGVGRNGSSGMRARWAAGQEEAGNLKLAFGRTPSAYFRPVDAGTANHRSIYWRAFIRTQPGWLGGAGWKFTRTIVFANSNWSEAAIGSVSGFWENTWLTATGESGTDEAGNLLTTRYNDFGNLRTIVSADGVLPLFNAANAGTWHCVEGHMQLNDAGLANGILEFWVNGTLQTRRRGLNWLGTFNAFGINAVFFENYWNGGPPQPQERYWDNLVVSTQRVGC
ncbi:MAG: Ig-like domain-containing protein [Gemmatimonadaceae bacterium]